MKRLLFTMAILLSCWSLMGQDESEGTTKFMLRGYSQGGFTATKDDNSFGSVGFSPLFIYRHDDKLIFESELEFEYEGGELSMALEYANVSIKVSNSLWLRAGKIIVPFGNWFERIHPSWINPLPTMPLGYGHGGILPTADLGIEARGAAYLGKMKFNYSAYLVNGPQLNDGDHEQEEAGMVSHGVTVDNNNNKFVGGRFGIFPFKNSSLELGFSGLTGKVGAKDSEFNKVGSRLYALDLSYIKSLNFMKSIISVRAQKSFINVDDVEYKIIHEDGDEEHLEFDNKVRSLYTQISIKPALVGSKFIRSLEFVGRYANINQPKGAPWAKNPTQLAFGVNYWFSWRSVLKFAYQINGVDDDDDGDSHDEPIDIHGPEPVGGHGAMGGANTFYIQWAIGF